MVGVGVAVLGAALATGFVAERVARGRDRRAPLPGQLVNSAGTNLHITVSGAGGPPVVIISGAGESSYSWIAVQRTIAQFTQVIAYDRAGLGSSDLRPTEQRMDAVDELRAVLDATGIPGPFVLLGHSLGGLIARRFMARYPNDVAGFVFVDSTHEFLSSDAKFKQGMAAVRGMLGVMGVLSAVGLPRLLARLGTMPMFPERASYQRQLSTHEYQLWLGNTQRNLRTPASRAEFSVVFEMLAEARKYMDETERGRKFGDLPMAVITNPGFGSDWLDMHRELAARSKNSVHYVSKLKGHNIQMHSSELVVQATRQVVESVRTGAPLQYQADPRQAT